MKKRAALAVVAAWALATVGARAEKLPPLPDGAFPYVVIPDTQLYRGEGAHVKKGKKPQAGPTRNPAFASRVDWIAANDVSRPDRGFAAGTNAVTLFAADGRRFDLPLQSKDDIARRMLEILLPSPR